MSPKAPARPVRAGGANDVERLVASNKKAFHDYEIFDRLEAGIVLQGTEVKSLREGRANLKDSYVMIEKGEPILIGLHVSAYEPGSYNNHEPERVRKLLLHKRQVLQLAAKIHEKALSIIPLRIYFKGSHVKVEIGVGRGKKLHDKRDVLRERDLDREARGAMKTAEGRRD